MPPHEPAGEPGGEHDEQDGAGDHERVEHGRRLPGEDARGLVERPVEAGGRHRHRRPLLGLQGQLHRREACLVRQPRALRPQLRELGAGGVAACDERRLRLGVEPGGGDPGREPRDPFEQRCLLPGQRVDLLLQVVDLDLLRDDRAEAREADDRLLHALGRDAQGHRRGAGLGGCVLHVQHVAAEPACSRECALGRLREGVVVLHGDRQLRRVALRPVRRGGGNRRREGLGAGGPGLCGGRERVAGRGGRLGRERRVGEALRLLGADEGGHAGDGGHDHGRGRHRDEDEPARREAEKRRAPPLRLRGGDRPHAFAQGVAGDGTRGLQLPGQVSGVHRLSPSPRVSSGPG